MANSHLGRRSLNCSAPIAGTCITSCFRSNCNLSFAVKSHSPLSSEHTGVRLQPTSHHYCVCHSNEFIFSSSRHKYLNVERSPREPDPSLVQWRSLQRESGPAPRSEVMQFPVIRFRVPLWDYSNLLFPLTLKLLPSFSLLLPSVLAPLPVSVTPLSARSSRSKKARLCLLRDKSKRIPWACFCDAFPVH